MDWEAANGYGGTSRASGIGITSLHPCCMDRLSGPDPCAGCRQPRSKLSSDVPSASISRMPHKLRIATHQHPCPSGRGPGGCHYFTTRPWPDGGARGEQDPRRIPAFCRLGLGTTEEVFSMCDYSLQHVMSRPAKVGDKLTTHHFNTGTIGFAAPEDANTAVCVLPGTELAFARAVTCQPRGLFGWKADTINYTTAIFRQINKHSC